MSTPTEELQNQVDEKLVELYQTSDPEKLGEIMYALTLDGERHYRALAKIRASPVAMRSYVDCMLQNQDECEALLNECRDRFGTQVPRLEKAGIVSLSIRQGLTKAYAGMAIGSSAAAAQLVERSAQAAVRTNILHPIKNTARQLARASALSGNPVSSLSYLVLSESASAAAVSEQVTQRLATAGTVAKCASPACVVLTVGMMGYELYSDIRSYWKGEIDGYKCAENLTSSFASVGAGFAGGAGAVALCAGAGPCGLIFAGVAGGVLATGLTALGVRAIFQGMFGTDRDRALDKAYGVLGLKGRPAPECIRQSYLRLARENHPDKGGDKEEFIKINSAYELIRASILS